MKRGFPKCDIEVAFRKSLCKIISYAEGNNSFMMNHKTWKKVIVSRQLYLMLLVPLIYILVFCYYPMAGAQIAFKDFSYRKGIWGSEWVGLKHFVDFLSNRNFHQYLLNTLRISVYAMIAANIFPVLLALCLNIIKPGKFKKSVEMVTYFPHFISTVVICGLLIQMLNPVVGLYGIIGKALTGQRPEALLGIASAFPHIYIWSVIWQNAGWNSIIYTAALANSDQQLHEAAQIDGASRLKRIWYIDIPTIIPTFTILVIMNAGRLMSVGYEKTLLLQNSMNLSYSEIISTYVYKVAFAVANADFGYSTAVNLFNSVINICLLILVNAFSKKVSETSLW